MSKQPLNRQVRTGAMLAIGLLVTAVAPTRSTASVIGAMLFLVPMFFAGLWIPRALMSESLRQASNYTPLGAGYGPGRTASSAAARPWPRSTTLPHSSSSRASLATAKSA